MHSTFQASTFAVREKGHRALCCSTALQGKLQKRNSKQAIVILADSKKEHVLQRCCLSTTSKVFTVSMNTRRKKSRMWTTDRDSFSLGSIRSEGSCPIPIRPRQRLRLSLPTMRGFKLFGALNFCCFQNPHKMAQTMTCYETN
jgi:hypothetical protein